ncbi:DUF4199 domain-containing protein [Marinoscillum sp. MHG1-6]|uniref:DUF4199 domain-containing protein n=1 Tax=Marinoscillum sp. MHG1-6 TaxID=2959627 RepID=UPI002157EDB6|nr:DUF4199 domain-containing protein [Marinoscillum sp. MHG1-6]
MFKLSLKYAAICGLLLCVTFFVSDYFGVSPLTSLVHLVFDLILFGIFIFFGTKEFKSEQENEILHFWQGMTVGFNIYFFSTLVFAVYLMIYFQVDTQLLPDYKVDAMKLLMDGKDLYIEQMGEETFQAQVTSIKEATAGGLVFKSVLKKIMAGFFITPLISIILRKQPK